MGIRDWLDGTDIYPEEDDELERQNALELYHVLRSLDRLDGNTVISSEEVDYVKDELEIEYRLSWEMPEISQITALEQKYGRGVWPRMTDDNWAKLAWSPSSRTSSDLVDIADQRAQLELWSATHDLPIRQVFFERRAMHVKEWVAVL